MFIYYDSCFDLSEVPFFSRHSESPCFTWRGLLLYNSRWPWRPRPGCRARRSGREFGRKSASEQLMVCDLLHGLLRVMILGMGHLPGWYPLGLFSVHVQCQPGGLTVEERGCRKGELQIAPPSSLKCSINWLRFASHFREQLGEATATSSSVWTMVALLSDIHLSLQKAPAPLHTLMTRVGCNQGILRLVFSHDAETCARWLPTQCYLPPLPCLPWFGCSGRPKSCFKAIAMLRFLHFSFPCCSQATNSGWMVIGLKLLFTSSPETCATPVAFWCQATILHGGAPMLPGLLLSCLPGANLNSGEGVLWHAENR